MSLVIRLIPQACRASCIKPKGQPSLWLFDYYLRLTELVVLNQRAAACLVSKATLSTCQATLVICMAYIYVTLVISHNWCYTPIYYSFVLFLVYDVWLCLRDRRDSCSVSQLGGNGKFSQLQFTWKCYNKKIWTICWMTCLTCFSFYLVNWLLTEIIFAGVWYFCLKKCACILKVSLGWDYIRRNCFCIIHSRWKRNAFINK